MPEEKKLLTPEERAYQRQVDYYKRLAVAETKADPIAAAKLAQAQKRLAATQQRRSAFEQVHPEYSAASIAAEAAKVKTKKTMLIGAGVLVAGGVGYFAYRKWKR